MMRSLAAGNCAEICSVGNARLENSAGMRPQIIEDQLWT